MSDSIVLQMCELAKQQKGLALVFLIEKVLTNPKIYVFGELLSVPSVQALRTSAVAGGSNSHPSQEASSSSSGDGNDSGTGDSTKSSKSYRTLELFAYGTYRDYATEPDQYIALTPAMANKLKQLSIVSMAVQSKVLSYEYMQDELQVQNVRELEDLIISTMYSGLITGKMNQQQSSLSVQQFIGRDVRIDDIPNVISQLRAFQDNCVQQATIVQESTKIVSDKRDLEASDVQAVLSNVRDNKNYSIGFRGGGRGMLDVNMGDDLVMGGMASMGRKGSKSRKDSAGRSGTSAPAGFDTDFSAGPSSSSSSSVCAIPDSVPALHMMEE